MHGSGHAAHLVARDLAQRRAVLLRRDAAVEQQLRAVMLFPCGGGAVRRGELLDQRAARGLQLAVRELALPDRLQLAQDLRLGGVRGGGVDAAVDQQCAG